MSGEAVAGSPVDVAEDPLEEEDALEEIDQLVDDILQRLPIGPGRHVFTAEPTRVERVDYRLLLDDNVWSPNGFLPVDSWLWKPVPAGLELQTGCEVQFRAVPSPEGRKWTDGWPVWGGAVGGEGEYMLDLDGSVQGEHTVRAIGIGAPDVEVSLKLRDDALEQQMADARTRFGIPALGDNDRGDARFDGWYVTSPWARWIGFMRWIKARNGDEPPRPMAAVRYELRQFRRPEVRDYFVQKVDAYRGWIDSQRAHLMSAVEVAPDLELDVPLALAIAGREGTKYVLGKRSVQGKGRHCSYHSSGLDDLLGWARKPRQRQRAPGEAKGKRYELPDFLPDAELGRLKDEAAKRPGDHCGSDHSNSTNEADKGVSPAALTNADTFTVFAAMTMLKQWHLRSLTHQVFGSTAPYDDAHRDDRRAMVQLTFGRPGTTRDVLRRLQTLVGPLTASGAGDYYRRYVQDPAFVTSGSPDVHDGHRRARVTAAEASVYDTHGLPGV